MPFYEYQCGACEHRLEALQKISDEPLVDCPKCNEPSLKKMISAAAFRLKGTGWYETDFKGDKKGDKKDGDKSPDNASADKSASDKSSSGSSSEKASKSTDSSSKESASKSGSATSASA